MAFAAACSAAHGVFESERFKLPQGLLLCDDGTTISKVRKGRRKRKAQEMNEAGAGRLPSAHSGFGPDWKVVLLDHLSVFAVWGWLDALAAMMGATE